MDFGERIASLRSEMGLTQEELTDKVDISRAALSHYEKSRNEPDFDTLRKLSTFFGVTADFILGIRPKPASPQPPEKVSVPILWTIRAGVPILAEENWDGEVDVPASLKADYSDIPFSSGYKVIGYTVSLLKEPPPYQAYRQLLLRKDLTDKKWQLAVEIAHAHGLDGEKVANLITLFGETVKRVR